MKKSDIIALIEQERANNLMSSRNLRTLIADQAAEIQRLKRVMQHTQGRMNSHAEAGVAAQRYVLDKLKGVVDEMKEGLGGGTWKTAAGHKRFIALLSDGHLRNIISYPQAPERVKEKCKAELERRAIDQSYRQQDEPVLMTFEGVKEFMRGDRGVNTAVQIGAAQAARREFVKDPRKAPSKRKPTRRARKA